MSPWLFVAAAYILATSLTAGLMGWAFASMHRAEVAADALKHQ